jgi:WD40 repeat protein
MHRAAGLSRGCGWVIAMLAWGVCARAGPLAEGDLLVSDLDTNVLTEYTTAGVAVQSFTFPDFTGGHRELRDVYRSPDGNVQAYNGTFTPQLSTLVPATGVITSRPYAGWSTVSNTTYGGIGAVGDGVFVTDMDTSGAPEKGVVRFSTSGGSTIRFGSNQGYSDLTIGGDGLVYALYTDIGAKLDVYNPSNNAFVRTITLDGTIANADVRGVAVASNGTIYAAGLNGFVYSANASGAMLNSRDMGVTQLTDIDLNDAGVLAVGTAGGHVLLTTTALTGQSSFTAGSNIATLHVAFTTPLTVPEPATGLSAALLVCAGAMRRPRR